MSAANPAGVRPTWMEEGPGLSLRWCLDRAIATLRGQYFRLFKACFVYELMSLFMLLVVGMCGAFFPLLPQLPHVLIRPIGDGVGYLHVRATRGERIRAGGMWDGLGSRYWTLVCIYLLRWLLN